MAIVAIMQWKFELHRLLFDTGKWGAIDLLQRFNQPLWTESP